MTSLVENPELSWTNVEVIVDLDDDNEAYEQLCTQSKPGDFYFDVRACDDYTTVSITPKAFFDKNGHCWDQHIDLDHILPSDLEEAMECIWTTDRTADEVKQELSSLGFLSSLDFSSYLSENDEGFDDSDYLDDEEDEEDE